MLLPAWLCEVQSSGWIRSVVEVYHTSGLASTRKFCWRWECHCELVLSLVLAMRKTEGTHTDVRVPFTQEL